MFGSIEDSDRGHAGTLWGVRICAVLVGFGAAGAVMYCVLFAFTTFFSTEQHNFANSVKSFFLLLACLALTYALLHISTGLFNGSRFAQRGGIAWGVLLLLFCWMLVNSARGPINPKASDAHEFDGPIVLLLVPTALWLIGYLSTKRVSTRFLASRA